MEEEGKTKGERTEMQRKLSVLNYMYCICIYVHSSMFNSTSPQCQIKKVVKDGHVTVM